MSELAHWTFIFKPNEYMNVRINLVSWKDLLLILFKAMTDQTT